MVCDPATPYSPFESYGLGWSDFARHYFRNHGCFLFLWVLRWFTSPGSLHTAMYSRYDNPRSYGLGSPIRTSPDHRLLASPRSFSQLTTSFIAYLRQGIHTHALSSLTIKFTLDTEFFLYFSKLPLKQCRLSTIRRQLRSPPYIGLMVEYILMLYTAPFRRLSRGLLYTARQNIQFSKINFDCHSAIKTLYSPLSANPVS